MRSYRLIILLVCTALLSAAPLAHAQNDSKGSRDHSLLTRMPGFYIDNYSVEEFAAFDPTVIDGKEAHWEGKKYTIGYTRKETATPVSML